LRELHADIIDEHSYALPEWFYANTHRYDKYDRNGPKVFMGEYAAQSVAVVSTKNRNDLECALSEAAYLTGLERNADVVRMASYAPLFSNTDAWQWTPDLIWVDSLRVSLTPNYFVQQLFSCNRGDEVLPVEISDAPAQKLFASAVHDDQTGEIIFEGGQWRGRGGRDGGEARGREHSGWPGKTIVLAGANLHDGKPNRSPGNC